MTDVLNNRGAIAIASRWIQQSNLTFRAAFIGGSVAYADSSADYDVASDVDCYLVIDGDTPEYKIGKINVEGVLLDVSWLAWSQLQNADNDPVMAHLMRFGKIVLDPHSLLTPLKKRIAADFVTPEKMQIRREQMIEKVRTGLAVDSSQLPQAEQVMNWLFPATLATHVILAICCAPFTVRKRFLSTKRYIESWHYESLLEQFGFDQISVEQAQQWLDETEILLDATQELASESTRFWASDLLSRDIAIDGSQRLIDGRFHREALFWIIATSARCLVVRNDAGADSSAYIPAFTAMLREIGIETAQQRAEKSADILEWIES